MRCMALARVGVAPAILDAFDAETREWADSAFGTDVQWALEFFQRFYHRPLARWVDLRQTRAAECASGLGLNALAFTLAGGQSIVGYDKTEHRVELANELTRRLGLAHRARFEVRDIHGLPQESVDVFFTLQTLEHVPRAPEALVGIGRRARRAVVLSTPNKWWPRDGHDTGLWFAHWLSPRWRRRYARFAGGRQDQFCRFLSPSQVQACLPGFRRVTSAYNFDRLEDWLDRFPCFFPYGAGGGRWLGPRAHRPVWRAAALVTRSVPSATLCAPMLEGIYLRS